MSEVVKKPIKVDTASGSTVSSTAPPVQVMNEAKKEQPFMVQGAVVPQLVVPAKPKEDNTPAPSTQRNQYEEDAVSYLTEHGWVRMGYDERGRTLWDDPVSKRQKAEKQATVILPVQGGGSEVVNQLVVPPAEWTYPTEQAMRVQKQREPLPSLEKQIELREKELHDLYDRVKKQAG